MNRAFPMTLSSGMVPAVGSPVHRTAVWKSAGLSLQWNRESAEWVRLSPITHTRSVGHLHRPELKAQAPVLSGIWDVHRLQVQVGLVQRLAVDGQSGRLRGTATVCPPTAITRLTRSFSSGGTNPTNERAFCTQRSAVLSERIDL